MRLTASNHDHRTPDCKLHGRMARLEERIDTMQAGCRADIARPAEDLAKRDKASIRWIVGTVLIIAVMSLLMHWPV